jgi:hypothetical protein
MRRQIAHSSRSFAPALRGLLTVFLTFAYIFVGFAGEISCAGETLASADQIDLADVPGQVDHGPKKSTAVVDHCYTCVPVLIPAPVLVAEPTAKPVALMFFAPTFLLEDHPWLDTPPPKLWT